MPLQNPDKIVTEERLAQFYQQILPYLGGMPDVLVNKFNRADLYSTDEKLIGRWIDGKPIYQRVVTGIGDTYQNWNQVVLSSDVNVNQVIDAKIISSDRVGIDGGGFTSIVAAVVESTGTVNLYNSISHTNANTAYALQYTKTTDSAVEIGDDTDYSTTEKIVGTWIDGKPIWQIVRQIETLPKSTGWNALDDNFVVNTLIGAVTIDSSNRPLYNGGQEVPRWNVDASTHKVTYSNPTAALSNITVIFRYTKTSS